MKMIKDDLNYFNTQTKEEFNNKCILSLNKNDLQLIYEKCVLKMIINKCVVKPLIKELSNIK